MRGARGFTLVEILVVVAIIGIGAGLVAISAVALEPGPEGQLERAIARARDSAVIEGRPVMVALDSAETVTLFPDGGATAARIVRGDESWELDPWTAELRRVP